MHIPAKIISLAQAWHQGHDCCLYQLAIKSDQIDWLAIKEKVARLHAYVTLNSGSVKAEKFLGELLRFTSQVEAS